MRFLHTADWQLGMTRHFLDADAQARFTAARTDAIARIGEVAEAENCEFVLVCGDVFESNALPRRVVARACEAMRAINVPIYLLPGNHDPLDAASIYDSAAFTEAAPEHVHVLRGTAPIAVGTGVQILPAPWTSKRPTSDAVVPAVAHLLQDQADDGAPPAELDVTPSGAHPGTPGIVRIVAGHGAVDTLSPDAHDPAQIRTAPLLQLLAEGQISYVALGDRHSTTEVAPGIAYSGAPEVTDFIETDPGNVLVVEVTDARARTTRHPLGTWSFQDLQFDLDSAEEVAAMDRVLAELPAKSRTVLRLALRGTLTLTEHAEMEAVLERHRETFASVRVWQRHTDVAVHVSDEDLVQLGVGGFVEEAVAELAGTATGEGPDREVARDSLALLYRLSGGGKR
ncbi:metallophosphoesterase family protein [Ruania zhangjianzhongii]|uniref:metallophosphoesterase family protein n=1 Tax=Ruania zhangjianzhongii TaxID=2603206 RepID=UPI0011C8604C|nr:exonuclease SbcCD subunit D [Ruania zhangjianzhongii]